jgi:NAD(P)-dependent dehydrogenase (short-subunit alcohol dehydrogenase family)
MDIETVVLVTGSTDGIGKQTAIDLARAGAHVIVHGRSEEKAETAREEVVLESGSPRVSHAGFDLASLKAIRLGAGRLIERHPAIDVVVHNAGVYTRGRTVSADGYELNLAVNHLAPFYLTYLLRPVLDRAAAEHGRPVRVVTVSSDAHGHGRIGGEGPISNHVETGEFDAFTAYASSKLANILFAFELARRSDKKRLTSNCLHPGVIDTKLLRAGFTAKGASTADGSATSVFLALSEAVDGVTGRYFTERRATRVAPNAQDKGSWKDLWQTSEKLCGL